MMWFLLLVKYTTPLEEIYYYHSDHLGTGTFLSDSAGKQKVVSRAYRETADDDAKIFHVNRN